MKTGISILILTIFLALFACTSQHQLDIYATTDIHGMLLPFDNAEGKEVDHSLSNLASLVEQTGNKNMVLLDNGDILQGDPLVYYYNFIDTTSTHIAADVLNYLGYDAETVGNHDMETGHSVYDRVRRELDFPLLAANAIDVNTGKPYFKPYTIIEKKGKKILVFGLITPSVPNWLPEILYKGIRFEGMVETARKWMPEMKAIKPDIIIGLFHSGLGDNENKGADENSSMAVAVNVPGFDLIIAGHDHNVETTTVINSAGDSVLVLDGGSRANNLMHAKVTFSSSAGGQNNKHISGEVLTMNSLPQSGAFNDRYAGIEEKIKNYTSEVLGTSDVTISTRDAYFGPSAFVDLIHTIQLGITGADISFAAPLSFDESINEGEIKVKDMFRLYRFENFLYKVNMTGSEIDRYLEHSYSLWLNTMKGKGDYLLKYRTDDKGSLQLYNGKPRLRNASYSFDSAMGIDYVVDVTKPDGSRVTIKSLTGGKPFFSDSTYTVAVNSYRANGGGGHFNAAGITHEILPSRILFATDRDLRYYMSEWIHNRKEIHPVAVATWSIIPAEWVSVARKREYNLLFTDK